MEKKKATIILMAINILVFVWQVIQLDSIMMSEPAAQYAIMNSDRT
jgi:hypothetical protein